MNNRKVAHVAHNARKIRTVIGKLKRMPRLQAHVRSWRCAGSHSVDREERKGNRRQALGVGSVALLLLLLSHTLFYFFFWLRVRAQPNNEHNLCEHLSGETQSSGVVSVYRNEKVRNTYFSLLAERLRRWASRSCQCVPTWMFVCAGDACTSEKAPTGNTFTSLLPSPRSRLI